MCTFYVISVYFYVYILQVITCIFIIQHYINKTNIVFAPRGHSVAQSQCFHCSWFFCMFLRHAQLCGTPMIASRSPPPVPCGTFMIASRSPRRSKIRHPGFGNDSLIHLYMRLCSGGSTWEGRREAFVAAAVVHGLRCVFSKPSPIIVFRSPHAVVQPFAKTHRQLSLSCV